MTFSAPRYTKRPFPHYRFVPGRDPHPTAHPDGHSYEPPGHVPQPVRYVPPQRWFDSEDYLYAADLYNHAYWWEAHEAWEGLWQLTDKKGTQGLFLQGLIQISACHLKLHVGKRAGVDRLLASSTQYLTHVLNTIDTDPYMGLDLAAFLRAVHGYYEDRLAAEPLQHDVAAYPYVTLSPRPAAE